MRSCIPVLAVLAALALPAGALAAPAKISPRASAVSAAGVATVEAANPNAYALRGTATVTVGGRAVARRSVRLPQRSVTTVGLRFDGAAVQALRAAGGRATITMKLRRAGGRTTTARRTLTLRLPSGGAQPAPDGTPNHAPNHAPGHSAPPNGTPPASPGSPQGGPGTPPGPSTGTPPAPPASGRWVGRMGSEGAYEDLELTVAGGQVQLTKGTFVPVSCMEMGGSNRIALSLELFDAAGPWTVGTDASVSKQGIAVNQLVSAGARTITYKVSNLVEQPGQVTGTLGISFFDSKYDIFTNRITTVSCFGAQSFEAVPAP